MYYNKQRLIKFDLFGFCIKNTLNYEAFVKLAIYL